MYDIRIFPALFKYSLRLALFLCLHLWCLCGSSLAGVTTSNGYSITYSDTQTSGYAAYYSKYSWSPSHPAIVFWYLSGASYYATPTFNPSLNNRYVGKYTGVYLDRASNYACYLITNKVQLDPDGDGLNAPYDPCPNHKDDHISRTVSRNTCTGKWLNMTVVGTCPSDFDSGTGFISYSNPSFSNIKAEIARAKADGCYELTGSMDTFSPAEYQNWWDGVSPNSTDSPMAMDTASSADIVKDQTTADVLDLASNATKEHVYNASSADSQAIINQTAQLQKSISQDISGLSGVAESAAATAHKDAENVVAQLQAIAKKATNSSFSVTMEAITRDEMEALMQTDREETYKVGDSSESDYSPGVSTFTGKLSTWSDALKAKVTGLLPAMSVETDSISPCVGASQSEIAGFSITLPEICLSDYESHYVMLGNLLYGVCGIQCILSVFGFRR